MIRALVTALAATATLLAGAAAAPPASANDNRGAVSIAGTVTTPQRYTADDIAAQAQVTLPDLRRSGHPSEVTGALLLPLVVAAGPVTPSVKNAQLRVTVTVRGRDRRPVAFALAEFDPSSGNHPALLVASGCGRGRRGGVDLVLPGDSDGRRTVRNVSAIDVAVAAPAVPTGLPAGAVQVVRGDRTVTLTAQTIGQLPVQTRTVNFLSGKGPQTHVETGPTLAAVLRAARVRTTSSTAVAAVADDGYVATVTPGEATSGRRPLLLSTVEDGLPLSQPRLVTDGDVYGGRYVTGVLGLVVTGGDHSRW